MPSLTSTVEAGELFRSAALFTSYLQEPNHSRSKLHLTGFMRNHGQLIVGIFSVLLLTHAAVASQDSSAAALFHENCAACHGPDGKGVASVGTPDLTSVSLQRSITDKDVLDTISNGSKDRRMPAWSGRLSSAQILSLTSYVRTLAREGSQVYEPGDDVLFSLPSGRPVERHEMDFNFAHRFPYTPTFTGAAKGAVLFGLDDFALPSFGFRYGITDHLSADVSRSPSLIGRPIQLTATYNLLDEQRGAIFNLALAAALEGQDNFRKNFTEDLEAIVSRSITRHAQLYFVPTFSFNDRPLLQAGFSSDSIADVPGTNAFSLGVGLAVDVRPTVALLGEVIPTLWNASELGIHRPAYSFGIQKKIYRHAFTLGFTNSPGVTTSQRAGTRATLLGDPGSDRPQGLFLGFDLTRRIR
jgi:mono/diheme cytochrome c family protein